ncbi:MAG: DUF72 domain-containing protein [Candidatus Hydrogenedentes bacterium]|nr:DUF72 domain-containing protein [Candidatus Hydrogenedentota bacterium]
MELIESSTGPVNASDALLRVGPAGWAYEDWKGIVYPPSMPRALHPLTFLARYFDTVEVNSSFYRPPNPKHCESWIQKVTANPRFRFTAKLWERFTHHRADWPTTQEIRLYKEGIWPLREADLLGGVLVQFPWSFKRTPENRQWLERIIDTFGEFPLVLEVRHTSWLHDTFYEGLRARKVALCALDQPLFKDSIEPGEIVTAPTGYVRFHGRNYENWFREDAVQNDRYNYLYSDEELKPWLERIKAMRKKTKDLYVVTNNHFTGKAVVNALEIQAALGGAHHTLPNTLLAHYPRLERIHQPAEETLL